MVVTSPPWYYDNVGGVREHRTNDIDMYVRWQLDVLLQIKHPLRDDGVVFWHTGSSENGELAEELIRCVQLDGWLLVKTIMWNDDKIMVLSRSNKYSWHEQDFGEVWDFPTEYLGIMMCKKCRKWYNYENMKDIISTIDECYTIKSPICTCGSTDIVGHAAPFPEEFVRRCMLLGSNDGDLVLDPFAGSGTTGVVGMKLKRRVVMIEIESCFCELAEHRLKRTEYESDLARLGSWYGEQAKKDRRYPFDLS